MNTTFAPMTTVASQADRKLSFKHLKTRMVEIVLCTLALGGLVADAVYNLAL